MKIILLTFIVIASVFANYDQAMLKFDSFTSEFSKSYDSEAERLYRYEIFVQNLDVIETLNQRSKGATYGVTRFADLTAEEFRNNFLMSTPMIPTKDVDPEQVLQPRVSPEAVPTAFDWRSKGAVTPVKDQGQCGSCWAFSIVENIESQWILNGKANASSLRLSEQQVVDCDNYDAGCNGGNPPSAYQYVISAGGLESEADYPYTAKDGTCEFKKSDVVASIQSWKYATTSSNEKTLQQNLVSWGPLSICVDAAYWQHYTGGVMTAWECAWINQLDHCVQLVGYDTTGETPYWMVRNSWGTSWGVDGYIHLEMFTDTCGMANEATSAVV